MKICLKGKHLEAMSGTRAVMSVFSLEFEIFGVAVQKYIKRVKSSGFCEELLSETEFEADLAIFCCYEYGTNASEVV